MAEGNLPTTGGELEEKNEFPATGGKKRQERLIYGDFYCLLIKYILILVHNFLDHFDLKVFRIHQTRTLTVGEHSCDHSG